MSNIATKLTYLNGTKQAIKQAINEDFEVIDNNTTFREYADEISSNNAKYKDLIPKETKNATNTLDISNSAGLDKALVTQYGNTYQYSTIGKNLFGYGITAVDNTASYRPNQYQRLLLSATTNPNEVKFNYNGTYCFGYIEINGIDGTLPYSISFNIKENTTNYTPSVVVDTTNSTNQKLVILINGNNKGTSTSSSNYFILTNIQVENGSTSTQYEPYTNGASPNPDYPQEIQVVSGDNTINICGKNLWNFTIATSSSNRLGVSAYRVQPNTTYTLSTSASNIQIYNYYKDINQENISNVGWVNLPYTFTTPANCYYIANTIRRSDNSNIIPSDITNVMLELNNQATTYAPYQSQTYEVDLPVENLLQCNIVSTTTRGVTITNNNDESFTLQGTATAGIGRDIRGEITLKAGTYTFSADHLPAGVYISLASASNTLLNGKTPSRTFTINADTTYAKCLLWIDRGCTVNDTIKIQLEKGSKQNSFTPYGTTPIELCKIGDYKDRIYPLNGKWYLEKQIGKVVLDGSENWYINSNVFNMRNINNYMNTDRNTISTISNYYKAVPNTNGSGEAYSRGNNTICLYYQNTTPRIFIRNDDYTTTDTFKTWLSTHNTIAYFVLATPTTTEITESNYPTLYNQLNNIKLFEGVNHITMTNESGLDVEFDITYYKDWKLD